VTVALGALLCLSLLLVGAAPEDWQRQVDRTIAPYRFSMLNWHARQLAESLRPLQLPAEAEQDPAGFVMDYYARLAQARAIAGAAPIPPAEQQLLDAMRPAVEHILAAQVQEAYGERGIYNPADRFVRVPITFPPVRIALEPPPHLLVISPRTSIASLRQDLLLQQMNAGTMESIEAAVEGLDLSALVTEIGGLGATYPTIVSDDSSLRYTIDTVAEEWLHQYLAFTPLGWRYVLHLLHLREDYAVAQINESLAGIVHTEIGDAVWQRYYAARMPRGTIPPLNAEAFDYRAFMRETRVEAERLLEQGQVEQAEAWMEQRRQILVREGYSIRKLNQAYFAFHGTYADDPAAITPIGDQLRALRAAFPSLDDYIDTVVRIRSHADLLDLLRERGIETASTVPTPSAAWSLDDAPQPPLAAASP